MAIAAHLEMASQAADRPRGARRKLLLETLGATASGDAASVLVHNISATGLLFECAIALAIGDTIEIDLPQAGMAAANVIWVSGRFHGCQFAAPISAAALGAAQLRSVVVPAPAPPAGPAAQPGAGFGARLQRLRRERGYSLARLAADLGVSKPTVWAWEQGRTHPLAARIEALAAALGVPTAELVPEHGSSDALLELLERTRRQIASAAGTSPERIRIMIEL